MSEKRRPSFPEDDPATAQAEAILGLPDSELRKRLRNEHGVPAISDAELGRRLARIPGYDEAEAAVAAQELLDAADDDDDSELSE